MEGGSDNEEDDDDDDEYGDDDDDDDDDGYKFFMYLSFTHSVNSLWPISSSELESFLNTFETSRDVIALLEQSINLTDSFQAD